MTALPAVQQPHAPAAAAEFSREQVDLIKQTVAKDATDLELQLFLHQCKRTGLDPFSRQIHAVKRWDSASKRQVMAIQVGIDGYRLIADRTGKYAGNGEPEFGPFDDDDGVSVPEWARVTVTKLVNGEPREFSALVFWTEYAARTKDGHLTRFWRQMPCTMLGKVAEAHALRKAFPAELAGIYTADEMDQAGEVITPQGAQQAPTPEATKTSKPTKKDEAKARIRKLLQPHPVGTWDDILMSATEGEFNTGHLKGDTLTLKVLGAIEAQVVAHFNGTTDEPPDDPGDGALYEEAISEIEDLFDTYNVTEDATRDVYLSQASPSRDEPWTWDDVKGGKLSLDDVQACGKALEVCLRRSGKPLEANAYK